MSNAPYRNLISFVYQVINDARNLRDADYHLSINDLSDDELGRFAALCLEYDNRDITGCYNDESVNPLDDDNTIALLRLLHQNDNASHIDFARTIRNHTIARYKTFMQELLDSACGEIYFDVLDANDKYTWRDRSSAETQIRSRAC